MKRKFDILQFQKLRKLEYRTKKYRTKNMVKRKSISVWLVFIDGTNKGKIVL